jgi:hypothetical protein
VPTGFYLLDNQRAATNFYRSRRGPILGIVVHCTAGLQGRPTGADSSAEQTAKYALNTTRKVSWHSGSDRDSHLRLLPDEYVAWHCAGANTHTIGHEISKHDTTWADEDPAWVEQTLQQAADCLRLRALRWRIPLRRASVDELRRSVADGGPPVGFLAHSDLDPARRYDPGVDFPWARFLALMANAEPPPKPKPKPAPAAPPFPLRRGSYFGPKQGPAASVSGFYQRLPNGRPGHVGLQQWQARMKARGWRIGVDGLYGPRTAEVARLFQRQCRIKPDGLIGPETWKRAWTEPVT